MKKMLVFLLLGLSLNIVLSAQEVPQRINHNGQDLFLSGINLAWINFGRDLQDFDEIRFVAALDEIAASHGNVMRWWLHTNGSTSPLYGEDGKVVSLGENDLENLRRAADLAYERGVLLLPTLWSHDMLNRQGSVPTDWNKLMIEDPAYTQAYIDNALIPMVQSLIGHPAIVAWEIFNEPEGTTSEFGWTDERTDMAHIQQFVNLLAGAIHRADPAVKVTNGSWNMQVLTDIEGMTNYYTNERLIEAGGDADGTLDFYTVHYYPEWFDETTSPFHHPVSHWELDRPLVIAEFPAKGLYNLGMGYLPETRLRNSIESFVYLFENGYAGSIPWTFYSSPHGSMIDAKPGMLWINRIAPEAVQIDISGIDHIPVVQAPIENLFVPNDTVSIENYVDLTQIFADAEDGTALIYSVSENSEPELVTVTISDAGLLSLAFATGTTGTATIEITATDSAGNFSKVEFVVQVVDPNRGNVALGKTVIASTTENSGFLAEFAVDGLANTRWSTEYVDGQWLDVDLGAVFTISQVVLKWETAFGEHYQIQVWDGSAWQTIFEEIRGDGEIDDIALPTPVDTRFVRMNGITRGEEWGFSLWEFEVYGVRAENPDLALETEPESFTQAPVAEATTSAASASSLLHSFEADTESWVLADYWAGGKGLAVSSEMASEGSQSLALEVAFTGGSWQEAGASFQIADGADWSSSGELLMDVYLPEGAESFIAQIFVKTGADWTWANTSDTALAAGAWTTVSADLSTLGDMTALHEYGIKVGTSVTAFEGMILVDNVRLVAVVAALPEPTAVPLIDGASNIIAISAVAALEETVGRYEKFELVVDLDAAFNNPYDPRDIRLDAVFIAPSGARSSVQGFYYQEFTYNGAQAVPSDDFSWRVRFTPTEVGDYRYTLSATASNGTISSEEATFSVSESDNRGFVRVDSRNPRYFAFDDGSTYFPVGLNVAWSTGNTIGDFETWFNELDASGGNFIRLWMAPWNMTIEWVDTGLGDYTRRQFRAYELDQVIRMAEERGIYIMLTLLNHGQFNTVTNPEWDSNPYNSANGGPCDTPECFASNPEAIRYWEQRLTYIVARWGYSPNIMAWEWWNEINWTPLVNPEILGPWMERNSAFIRSIDPNQHLLTHSGSLSASTNVWSSLDFTQDHFYDRDDFPRTFLMTIPEWSEAYPDKPFLVGEFGRASAALSYDTDGVELHLGIWSAPMNGAAGTAMSWWWDTYIHPNNLWHPLYDGISAFFAGEDLGAHQWRQPETDFVERTRARVFGLQAENAAYIWVLNRDYSPQYLESAYLDFLRDGGEGTFVAEFPEVGASVLVVSSLEAGSYTIEIWDTFTGEIIESQSVESSDGSIQIALPAFNRDLALKVKAQ